MDDIFTDNDQRQAERPPYKGTIAGFGNCRASASLADGSVREYEDEREGMPSRVAITRDTTKVSLV